MDTIQATLAETAAQYRTKAAHHLRQAEYALDADRPGVARLRADIGAGWARLADATARAAAADLAGATSEEASRG